MPRSVHSNLIKCLNDIYNNDSISNVTNINNKYLIKMNQHITIMCNTAFTSDSMISVSHDHDNNNNQVK